MNRYHHAVVAVARLIVEQDLVPALSPTAREIQQAFGPAFRSAPVTELILAVDAAVAESRAHRTAVAAGKFRDQHGPVGDVVEFLVKDYAKIVLADPTHAHMVPQGWDKLTVSQKLSFAVRMRKAGCRKHKGYRPGSSHAERWEAAI